MSKAISFAAFIIGAGIGSVATWYVTKTRYEKLTREEIESVREAFSKRKPPSPKKVDISEKKSNNPSKPSKKVADIMGYSRKLNEEGYVDYSSVEQTMANVEKPYVITPDEYAELSGYSPISLTYYADSVLTDDLDQVVEDVEGTVGFESLKHFGEYENDCVFVRNDRLKCDYEILLDRRNYSDILEAKPYLQQ